MLAGVRQTAENLLALIEPAIKDDLNSLSLIDIVVDARSQSPKSLYVYLKLNENHTIPTSFSEGNVYMSPVLASALLPILSHEIDNILDNTLILWPVAVDFLYSLIESSNTPLSIFFSSHLTRQCITTECRASLFRPQKSFLDYICQIRSHSVQRRWFLVLFQTYSTFRWILGLIISAFLLSSAEESVRQMGPISSNPSIHLDFTGIDFYSFKEIEERFCQTCITKHRASSQARRAISGRSIKSTRSSRTVTKSTRSSRAPSITQATLEKSRVSSPGKLSKSRADSTTHSLYQDSILTTADLEYNDNDAYSTTKLQLTLALQPSDLSLSLAELLYTMQRKVKKQGYLSLLKSGLQSMIYSAPKEQQWKLPPVTLLSVFEPFCNLCTDSLQQSTSDAPSLTYLIMKRLELQIDDGCTWKARTLNFHSDCDRTLFTIAAAKYYNRFGEYLYTMDRKLAKFSLAPVLLGPAFYGYQFFIDRALIVEKLCHWNTINLSKLIKTANLDGGHSNDMILFASSGSKMHINRQVPIEFVFLQLILTALHRWKELKNVLFDNLSERVERVFILELEHAIISHTLRPIEDFIRSTIETCPLLQQHIPTLVLLINSVETLEQRFLAQEVDVKDSMLSIKAYVLELIHTQLEIIHGDFQILLEFRYNQLHNHGAKSRVTRTPPLVDLIAQPEAYAIGCLFETMLSLQIDKYSLKTSNPILHEYINKITGILQEIIKDFFQYINIFAQSTLLSEVDQLARQLSECHILLTLMTTGGTHSDISGQIINTIRLQIKNLFIRLCGVLAEKGVTEKADQITYIYSLKRSHMIHKQLLVKLEQIENA